MNKLKDKIIFITGASRGIGREIALRCAKDGAKIVVAAKTKEPHPTLSGTIYSVAEEITAAGGTALPIQLDIRDEAGVQAAIEKTATTFGGIDILINNASAIFMANTLNMPMKRFDLIIMTGHAFQVLLENSDVLATFATMRRHIKPTGKIVSTI